MTTKIELSTHDSIPLQGQVWLPDHAPRAVVCLIHGFGEHIGRYDHVAEAFNAQGIALAAVDLRGHGKSGGKRGHTPSYQHFMQDLELCISQIRMQFAKLPLFLYGHSMGGNLVLNYLLRKPPDDLRAVVVTSPWLRLTFEPPKLKVMLGKLMRKVYPAYSEPNDLNPEHLSTDRSIGQDYVADPLINDKISTETYFAVTEAGLWALENAIPFSMPVLLMHGDADQITSPGATHLFAKRANTEWVLWEGMYHEIHNEKNKAEVIKVIVDWIISKL